MMFFQEVHYKDLPLLEVSTPSFFGSHGNSLELHQSLALSEKPSSGRCLG